MSTAGRGRRPDAPVRGHSATQVQVLRCVLLGAADAWPAALIAVALDTTAGEVAAALEGLERGGYLRADQRAWIGPAPGYDWCPAVVTRADPEHPAWERAAYTRLAGHLRVLAAAAAGTAARERAMVSRAAVPGIGRRMLALGRAQQVARLVIAWWEVADQLAEDPGEAWMRELARLGVDAALASGSVPLLAGVLDAGGCCAHRMGDHLAAGQRWTHAVAVWQLAGHRVATVPILEALLRISVAQQHCPSALDVLGDLVRTHDDLGDREQVCWAQLRTGIVLLLGGAPRDAAWHLRRARDLLDDGVAPLGAGDSDRAGIDELLGRAQWGSGHPRRARRSWRAALACLDEDRSGTLTENTARAQVLRALIALPDAADLPSDPAAWGRLAGTPHTASAPPR